jgi:hypothetical protein
VQSKLLAALAAMKQKLGRGPKISTAFLSLEIGAAPAPRECQWNIL